MRLRWCMWWAVLSLLAWACASACASEAMQWLERVLPTALFVRPLLLCLPELCLVLLFWQSRDALVWSCLENLVNGCLLLLPLALSKSSQVLSTTTLLLTVVLTVEACGVCFLLLERRQWWWHLLSAVVFLALYTAVAFVPVGEHKAPLRSGERSLAVLPALP